MGAGPDKLQMVLADRTSRARYALDLCGFSTVQQCTIAA
jgi:hypothetical protein